MSFDGRELRNALGQYATGVCIISTVTDAQQAVGMTANSFASVSLDPPLVLWSLQNNSEMYSVYATARFFSINILSSEQLGHSNEYAKKGGHELAASHYQLGEYGSPIIHDALANFECELETTHDGGDHLIIVGRVRGMQQRAGAEPLLFFSGGYRELR
jgi:flavin reductase (DIM6/NTAB) family NADH-FMN oxidoreductase RutF